MISVSLAVFGQLVWKWVELCLSVTVKSVQSSEPDTDSHRYMTKMILVYCILIFIKYN